MTLNIDRYSNAVNYTYDSGPPYGGCTCPEYDYCRCYQITNVNLKVNVEILINELYNNYFDDNLENEDLIKYCIGRLVSLHKIYDEINFEYDIEQGYYGEEFGGIKLINEKFINDLLTLSGSFYETKEYIEFVLNKEYGYLLEILKDKKYKIKTIDILEIEPHDFNKHKSSECTWINNLPIGIYIKNGSKYRCIDGHHRLNKAYELDQNKLKVVLAI